MSDELDKLESAVTGKDENYFIDLTINKTNSERIKLRDDYKAKFGRDLLEDFGKNFKSDFLETLIGVFKSPAEYDADLLYNAMKGIGSDKNIITEVLCFRNPERINQIKQKFQEKYGKDLISEIKSETSGDYRTTLVSLLEKVRNENPNVDVNNCIQIADELYQAGEGKFGTNESVFIKYFTTLSKEELITVGKEYHKKYKKNIVKVVESETDGDLKKLFKAILYGLVSPSEYFARQINYAVQGAGTSDENLIRIIVSRKDEDIKMIKKYYKKLFGKNLADVIKEETSGNYQKILLALIGEN